MEATFEALVQHGYADLTIQTIADEFEKSKSLLYYHYDTKDHLLTDFLQYVTDGFATQVEPLPDSPPRQQMDAVLDLLVPQSPDDAALAIRTALCELRLQSPYDETYAKRFAALDEELEETFTSILASGVETGVFDIEPAAGAHALTGMINGEMLRIVTDGTDPANTRTAIDAVVDKFTT